MIRNGKCLVSEGEMICRNIFSQGLGLMFRFKKQNLIMVFNHERKISLHNFFVFFPLEVLVLDTNKKVVEMKKNFRPFTFWNSSKQGKYLIELGRRESWGNVKVGDYLLITIEKKCNY